MLTRDKDGNVIVKPWKAAKTFWKPVLQPNEPIPPANQWPIYGEARTATNIPIHPRMLDRNYIPPEN